MAKKSTDVQASAEGTQAPAKTLAQVGTELKRVMAKYNQVEGLQAALKEYNSTSTRIEAGQLLIEAKDAIGHGNWDGWLLTNFGQSARTARQWMQLARDAAQNGTDAVSSGNERLRRIRADVVKLLPEEAEAPKQNRSNGRKATPALAAGNVLDAATGQSLQEVGADETTTNVTPTQHQVTVQGEAQAEPLARLAQPAPVVEEGDGREEYRAAMAGEVQAIQTVSTTPLTAGTVGDCVAGVEAEVPATNGHQEIEAPAEVEASGTMRFQYRGSPQELGMQSTLAMFDRFEYELSLTTLGRAFPADLDELEQDLNLVFAAWQNIATRINEVRDDKIRQSRAKAGVVDVVAQASEVAAATTAASDDLLY